MTLQRLSSEHVGVRGLAAALDRGQADSPKFAVPLHGPAAVDERDVLIEQLRQERQQAYEAAREQGRREGQLEAEQSHARQAAKATTAFEAECRQHLEELQDERSRLRELGAGIGDALQAIARDTVAQAAEIAYAAALRLYGGSGVANVDFSALCARILQEQRQRPLTLRVAPAQLPLAQVFEEAGICVESDHRLVAGQCRLDTGRELIDTGLDVRLEALKAALLEGLESSP